MKALLSLTCLTLVACGGNTPPPKTEETARQEAPRNEATGGAPSVSQELGSIDQRAVEQMFDKLQTKLEVCHKQGRGRVEYLSGDMKVFLRVDTGGKVKYSYFDESSLGDRETEKCILDLFAQTDWPKPQGGEAEIRNAFGWSPGGERQPTAWPSERASSALDDNKDVKSAVTKCKAGVTGAFRVTAYIEPGEAAGATPQHGTGTGAGTHSGKGEGKGGGKKKGPKKPAPKLAATAKPQDHGGKFKAIGVTPPGKEGADKVDCIADALKGVSLPTPGSYAAKVTFTL